MHYKLHYLCTPNVTVHAHDRDAIIPRDFGRGRSVRTAVRTKTSEKLDNASFRRSAAGTPNEAYSLVRAIFQGLSGAES